MIQTTPKGKDIKVMVWAAFWSGGVSDLYPLERDWEAKKMGYSANSYIDVLEQNLTQFYQPGQISCRTTPPYILLRKCVFGLKCIVL